MVVYPNWEVSFFNVAPRLQPIQPEPKLQPEPEPKKYPKWPWFLLLFAILLFGWIVIKNFRQIPPPIPPKQVENLDDDLKDLIEELKELLFHCEKVRDNNCTKAINELLEEIYTIARFRKMNLGNILEMLPNDKIIIAECSDGMSTYLTILFEWEGTEGFEQYGVCNEWVVFLRVEGTWAVVRYNIKSYRMSDWEKFLDREGLPPLPPPAKLN